MSKKPVPSKKQAVSSTRSRWATYMRIKRKKIMNAMNIVKDADGSIRLSHHVNPTTGQYKGRQILNVKTGTAPAQTIEA